VNLQIVRGDATPEEIAAIVAVLTARARRAAAARTRAAGTPAGGPWRGRATATGSARTARAAAWADRSRRLRAPLVHGQDAWRTSARPG
jgi:Acyl-CoA carboxylase epsilon subunit